MEPAQETNGAEPGSGKHETGCFIVVFDDEVENPAEAMTNLRLNVADARETGPAYKAPGKGAHDGVYLDHLRTAVVTKEARARVAKLPGAIVEPERRVYAQTDNVTGAAADFSAPPSGTVRPSPFIQGPVGAYPFIQGPVGAYPFIQGPVGAYPFIQGPVGAYPFIEGPVGAYPFIQGPVGAYPFIQASPAAMVTYLAGYRDAAQGLLDRFAAQAMTGGISESQATWGLQAIQALLSRNSGRDIGVAVLDTGFDSGHPDFQGREPVTESFVDGEGPQDGHGHGTHCIGTACGPRDPAHLPRYGIAYNAKIYSGKVLSDDGVGTDGQVLAGMNWAIDQGCRVISMSLGTPARPGDRFSRAFERIAQRALNLNTIIVAAAGNESRRDMNIVNPVSHPANCPSIMAVAAVDPNMRVAFFSNQGEPTGGGQVDISAPGVDVYSSFLMPTRYRTISGTSMATPHVAGVAALFAEIKPDATAVELKKLLQDTAMAIPGATVDIGAGLVQAP